MQKMVFISFLRGRKMEKSVAENRRNHLQLWETLFMTVALGLVGIVTNAMRGVALDFDKSVVKITVIFESTPSDDDIEKLRDLEAEVVSSHDYMSDLEILVISDNQKIGNIYRNLGWVFLRKE